jgi:hypothetical protein
MQRKLLLLQRIFVVFCVAMLLAVLVPASATAFSFGQKSSLARPLGVENLELTIDSLVSRRFATGGLKRAILSLHRYEDMFDRRSSESEQSSERKFGQRWTKHGSKVDRYAGPAASSVPEPSTAVLMMLGLAGLAGARRMGPRAVHLQAG